MRSVYLAAWTLTRPLCWIVYWLIAEPLFTFSHWLKTKALA